MMESKKSAKILQISEFLNQEIHLAKAFMLGIRSMFACAPSKNPGKRPARPS